MRYILPYALFVIIYLYLIKPGMRKLPVRSFLGLKFAHRGLHGDDIPENTLASFERAVDGGVGIEMDLQLTSDNEVVVFHDDDLVRSCGVHKRVRNITLTELRGHTIFNTNHSVPLFSEVLSLVDGRVPLLIELKSYGIKKGFRLCREVVEKLKNYKGSYCIESFNPLYLLWFRINHPHIARGLLLCRFPYKNSKRYIPAIFLLRSMLLNALSRPDFIAYDYSHRPLLALKLCRFIFRVPLFAWTVPQSLIESTKLSKYHSFIYEE